MTRNISLRRRRGRGAPRDPRETGAFAVAIVAAAIFDHLARPSLGLAIAVATVVAFTLRRPAFLTTGLTTLFVGEWAVAVGTGGGWASAANAAIVTAVAAATCLATRAIFPGGGRVTTARTLVEVLFATALAGPLGGAAVATLLTASPLGGRLDPTRLADWPGALLGAAAIVPIVLSATREDREIVTSWREALRFGEAAAGVGLVAWAAERLFPYPFVVACVPLLVAATVLRPTAVAVVAALCSMEMAALAHSSAPGGTAAPSAAIAFAAALTGLLPMALSLLLAELKTERQRLWETGDRLHRLLASIAGHGFCSLDRDGRVTTWNDEIAEVTGFREDEVLGKHFAMFFPTEVRDAALPANLLRDAVEQGHVECIGWRLKGDGRRYWAHTQIEAIRDAKGRVVGFTKSVHDKSDLERSESALMAAERRWGFALGSAGQGIWELDLVEGRMHYSDVYAAMLGLSATALGDDPAAWKARVHPDDVRLVPLDDAIEDSREVELRLRHAEGRWIWVSDRRRIAERDANGRPTRVIGIHTDVTARKLAEEKFRLSVEASPSGLLIADADGRITLVNREIERMFGYEPGALLGRSIDELVPEAQRGDHAARRASFNRAPSARRMGAGRDLNARRRDGKPFPVEIGLNPIATTEGAQILCVVTDITARKQAEADLAMSEARHRMMADHFIDLVVHLDLDLTRTWVSPACRDILGVEPEVLLGRSPSSVAHPDDLPAIERALRAVAAGEDRGAYSARYRHRAGHWIWMEVSLRLLRGADGAPAGILAVARDTTRARAAEEALKASEATFRGAMESASIGMALEAPDGRWMSVNRALCDTLGLEERDLIGHGQEAFTLPDDVERDDVERRRLLAGEIASYQVEKRWLNAGGGLVWTHQSVSLDRAADGAPRRLILQIRDVTEERKIEQMKSEFVSMVSHELRTPLTSIRGALGLVLGAMAKELPPRVVQLVDIAHKNSERLIPLVNDILDLDKIDAGLLRVEPVEADAVQLVGQAVEATRSFADRYGVGFFVDLPASEARVRVDEGRFIQVVTNLLSNAAKFSPRGANVVVTVRVVDGAAEVAVRDHGPGIPDDFRPKIFGRFAQADSATTRVKGGSGLGLHVSRQLVELMGGEIDFDSMVGVGSTFRVRFPLVGAGAAAVESEADAAPPRHLVAILIDETDLSDLVAAAAEAAGLDVVQAITPNALAILIDRTFALSPTGTETRRRLDTEAEGGAPVFLVEVADDTAQDPIDWPIRATWTVRPAASRDLVARFAELAADPVDDRPRILHVEDDGDLGAVVAAGLADRAEVVCVPRIAAAMRYLEARRFDLVLVDPDLPDGNGLALLVPTLTRRGIPFVILSADESSDPEHLALANLVKSRVGDRQLVDTILSILAGIPRPAEEMRHVG
ncbi:MAG: PAS domain S-box protein [Phyllobacteriaceae bacterium]|nr:PAS domain S-box protein [Phyllobacteriaceae bacterium]